MPIFLDDLQNNLKAVKTYSPKFFDSKLTGVGKKTGVLNENKNPKTIPSYQTTSAENLSVKKRHYTNGGTEVSIIPVNILSPEAWAHMDWLPLPPLADMAKVAEGHRPGNPGELLEVYVQMKPHSIVLEETKFTSQPGQKGYGGVSKKCVPSYQFFCFVVPKGSKDTEAHAENNVHDALYASSGVQYSQKISCNPKVDLLNQLKAAAVTGLTIDPKAVDGFFDAYSLYDAMCERSEEWQTTIHLFLDKYFQNVSYHRGQGSTYAMNTLASILHRIEDYNVPLDLYRDIYASIQKHFAKDDAEILCKENLNLLLSDTLQNLNANKPGLSAIPAHDPPVAVPVRKVPFSPEQRKAITCADPLVLVQSGAGTGKAQPLYTHVLTPTGWTTMGELKVGDEVVGSDGKGHKVLKVHERGLRDGYRLTFRDGSSTTACKEHLWTVVTKDTNRGGERRQVITTEQWLNDYHRTHSYLPVVEPVQYAFGERDLPLDPYFLGALLADGCLCHSSIQYTKSEQAVVDTVSDAARKNGFEMREVTCSTSTARQWKFSHRDDIPCHKSVIMDKVGSLGLNVRSRDKFIPETYKTASPFQRMQLLHGLFDGDGDVRTGRGYARFNTASDRMADDVLRLLWSLGLSATKQRQKHSRGDYWSVNLLDGSWDPFLASCYKGKATGAKRPMRRGIKSAEPVYQVPMRCIEIDAPDQLYVTEDFVVTHNSSTILGRIDWMIACGIQPHDIMVLSFTNAAADHITDLNPDVHSMTIARMIHTIYTANFPKHELSTLDTIMNSIEIYFGNDDIANRFKRVCRDVWKNEADGFTKMNNFVERHYDEVMNILDTIRQTSLELEIIICYQKIETLSEPPEVQSKYLIIDEVQDNSIFEFIYTLKYVDKHQEALFIVGKLRLPTLNPTNCGNATRACA